MWLFYFVSEKHSGDDVLPVNPQPQPSFRPPLGSTSFSHLHPHPNYSGYDLPVAIQYVIKRYEGFHMMTIVCTFLFPLALQGATASPQP